ncbi:hypothetical protein [Nocardiopsis sp. NPDC058789]|uniref:hypothetical protein n=1 Tax=Nocardiopsis sp. NPDC058789 TaxID=3346634 RepID=UPI00366D196C
MPQLSEGVCGPDEASQPYCADDASAGAPQPSVEGCGSGVVPQPGSEAWAVVPQLSVEGAVVPQVSAGACGPEEVFHSFRVACESVVDSQLSVEVVGESQPLAGACGPDGAFHSFRVAWGTGADPQLSVEGAVVPQVSAGACGPDGAFHSFRVACESVVDSQLSVEVVGESQPLAEVCGAGGSEVDPRLDSESGGGDPQLSAGSSFEGGTGVPHGSCSSAEPDQLSEVT